MTYTTESNYTQSVSGNRDFNVGFPFLSTADIKVQQNGTTKTLSNDYTIVQSGANTTVNFNTAPADNDTIRLFRDTDIDAIEATYAAGSSIRASDLNTNNTQLLYAAQEFGTLKTDNSVSFSLGNKGDIQINSSTDYVINNNAVELAMMADNSVGTSELVNDSVNQDKIADNAVITAAISNLNVTTAKLADGAVTVDKLAANSVTAAKVNAPGGFNPVGTVIWYAGSTAPAGYLKCNGDAIPNGSGTVQSINTNFSALYAVVGSSVPDLRGEFVRGWDDGKGTDSGRSIRSSQTELFKEHTHTPSVSQSTTGAHNHAFKASNREGDTAGWDSSEKAFDGDADSAAYTQAADTNKIYDNGSHNHSVGVTIANTGGAETRPRNIALLACIKY